MDMPPPDDYPFNSTAIERVETVEALPFSHAFERMMYDKRSARQATHVMDKPIILTPHLLETVLPEEVRNLLTSSHCVIDNLCITHTDIPENTPHLDVAFTADRKQHLLQAREDKASYQVETYGAEDMTYIVDSRVALSLLAAFVYARQYDERDPSVPIDYVESQLELPRSEDANLSERLVMTLGHLDGRSTITTTSSFVTENDDILIAKMTEGESPTTSSIQSKLELAAFAFVDDTNQTDLHQNIVNTGASYLPEPTTLENRFARQHTADQLVFIDPEEDYSEWSRVCDTFLAAIESDLATYKHLDDTPY